MPTYPISDSKSLGLGATGGATQSPALVQGVGFIENLNDAPSGAVWCYPSSTDPTTLTGQVPGGLIFGLGSYAGQVYVVDDSGAPVMFLDNGALVGTLVVDSLDLGDNDPINFGDGDDIVMKWNGTKFVVTQAAADSTIDFGVSGAGINVQFYGDTAGYDASWDQTNNQMLFADNAAVGLGSGAGAAADITMLWNGTKLLVGQLTANSAIDLGVSGAGIDLQLYGDTAGRDLLWDQSADALKAADNTALIFGTGLDLSVLHDGTNSLITNTTGNVVVDNQSATGAVYVTLGTDTSATEFAVRNNSESRILLVTADGAITATGTITAGGLASAGTVQVSDGGILLQVGSGTGTGDKIACIGVDATHGIATYCYEATVSPAAIETALFTIPVMSVVDSVQANVESALTGGGTTATFSIGITGDVDAYGTASNSGVQADLLTKNAKANAFGRVAAGAGASIGLWSAATVDLKLIGAATGGAAAGDTALTVGSVKVRVVYRSALSLADAP